MCHRRGAMAVEIWAETAKDGVRRKLRFDGYSRTQLFGTEGAIDLAI